MSDIKERISKICPSAVFEDGEILFVEESEPEWYGFAKALRDDLKERLTRGSVLSDIHFQELGDDRGEGRCCRPRESDDSLSLGFMACGQFPRKGSV